MSSITTARVIRHLNIKRWNCGIRCVFQSRRLDRSGSFRTNAACLVIQSVVGISWRFWRSIAEPQRPGTVTRKRA